MEIIVSGSPREIEFVKSVCRKKIQRGLIRIAPAVPATIKPYDDEELKDDEKAVAAADIEESAVIDDKYLRAEDDKTIRTSERKSKTKTVKK